jgi:hypothetical protein
MAYFHSPVYRNVSMKRTLEVLGRSSSSHQTIQVDLSVPRNPNSIVQILGDLHKQLMPLSIPSPVFPSPDRGQTLSTSPTDRPTDHPHAFFLSDLSSLCISQSAVMCVRKRVCKHDDDSDDD